MQVAGFMVGCPFKLGDRIAVAYIGGKAVLNYPAGVDDATITDIITAHSLKNDTVTFLYELNGKEKLELIRWEDMQEEEY